MGEGLLGLAHRCFCCIGELYLVHVPSSKARFAAVQPPVPQNRWIGPYISTPGPPKASPLRRSLQAGVGFPTPAQGAHSGTGLGEGAGLPPREMLENGSSGRSLWLTEWEEPESGIRRMPINGENGDEPKCYQD